MTAPIALSVIIVNYRSPEFLGHCLYSLNRALHGISAEILVVDNASNDHSRDYLSAHFPKQEVHWLPTNLGFGKANNLALEQARGNLVWMLNPDTLVPESLPKQLLEFFDSHPKLGGLGNALVDGSGHFLPESKRGKPTPWASFCKLSGLADRFPTSRWLSGYYQGHLSPRKTQPIPVLSGASLVARRSQLLAVGGFDTRYFMYGEDVDLSIRLAQDGHDNWFLAEPAVLHFKGESTNRNSRAYLEHFYGAMRLYVKRYHPGWFGSIYHAAIGWLMTRKLAQLARMPETVPTTRPEPGRPWLLYGDSTTCALWKEQLGKAGEQVIQLDSSLPDNLPEKSHVVFVIGDTLETEACIRYLQRSSVFETRIWWAFPSLPVLISSRSGTDRGLIWPAKA